MLLHEHDRRTLVEAGRFVTDECQLVIRVEPRMQLGHEGRDHKVEQAKIRRNLHSHRLRAIGRPNRGSRIDIHADRKYLRSRRAAEGVQWTADALVARPQKIPDRNYDARARPGVVRDGQNFGLLTLLPVGVVNTSRGARLQVDVRAFQNRSVGVVVRVIEVGQLRLAAGSQLDVRDLDVGLSVKVSILAAQYGAVASTLQAVTGSPDRNAGRGSNNRKTGRREAERLG